MKASEIIKNKLEENQGRASIRLLNGGLTVLALQSDGRTFVCDKLPAQHMGLMVFDIIEDFLKQHGGKAPKGCARGYRVGEGLCGEDTVIYAVATKYYGKNMGEGSFDPVFVLAAIMEWAGIAKNGRGYLELK